MNTNPPATSAENYTPRADVTIPLPVLVLFWVTAAGVIDTSIYELLRTGWYLILDHELPPETSLLSIGLFPFGIGLIQRSPNSKSCIQTLFILIFILIIAMAGFEIFDFGSTRIDGQWKEWLLITGIAIWTGVVLWYFKRYDAYFNDPDLTPAARRNEKALIWLVIVSGIVSSLTLISVEYEQEKRLERIFAVNLDFYAVDSETKEPLERFSCSLGHSELQDISQRFIKREKGGIKIYSWSLRGFTNEPLEIEISAEGYEDGNLTVTKAVAESSGEEIPIPLIPIAASEPEPAPNN